MHFWIPLATIIAVVFLGEWATATQTEMTENHVDIAENEDQVDLYIPEINIDEYRRLLRFRSPRELGFAKKCENLTHKDIRVGLFLAVPGAGALFLGREYGEESGENKTTILMIARIYNVQKFSKGGSPFEGSLTIVLQRRQASEERTCLEALRNASIKWATVRDIESDSEDTVDMTVEDVRFTMAGRVTDSGATVRTGETVVTITLSESWWSMVYRKSNEQIWGAVLGMIGTGCLMVIGYLVRRLLRYRKNL